MEKYFEEAMNYNNNRKFINILSIDKEGDKNVK